MTRDLEAAALNTITELTNLAQDLVDDGEPVGTIEDHARRLRLIAETLAKAIPGRRAQDIAGRPRDEYLSLRRNYEPENIKLVIIAESPPASGLYFYDASGDVSEPLFRAFMNILDIFPKSKGDGLRAFQEMGWVLVDATYTPVNPLTPSRAKSVILNSYEDLKKDIRGLLQDNLRTPLVLMKANICQLLEPRLVMDGFNVLNKGRPIFFPVSWLTKQFLKQFRDVVMLEPGDKGPG